MPDIFGVNLAGLVNDALGDLVFDQTLTKVSSVRDPSDSTKRIQTRTDYSCKGFIDGFKDIWVNGAVVSITDRKIIILGDTLDAGIEPEAGDEILAEGDTYTIISGGVARDPAGATYECRCN